MMVVDNLFEIGEIVYLKTDKDQTPAMVTGIMVGPNGLTYRIAKGVTDTWQFEIELSREKDYVLTTSN